MVFSSYQFLVAFMLPVVAAYYVLSRIKAGWCLGLLTLCSIVFYAFWDVRFVPLLLISIAFNYAIGRRLLQNQDREGRLRFWLLVGVTGNLAVLVFFKYTEPLLTWLLGWDPVRAELGSSIILPLGISFFTFTQIGYLIDCRDGRAGQLSPLRYSFFVTFFPHLIAGPILHIREMAPQIINRETYRVSAGNLAIGASYFIFGLSKKVLLADRRADFANFGFSNPASLDLTSAWISVLSYSVQLYFDFSGYSDMANGLAYMFGFKFPLNFASPYRSTNIIQFWQRWHITLTRYLTLLLFNPIALFFRRKLAARGVSPRAQILTAPVFALTIVVPTVYTMALAGIWHGAGFQFLIFGLLHAFYLCVNHIWRTYGPKERARGPASSILATLVGLALTYLCVLVGQVFFRAASTAEAVSLLEAMAGLNGSFVPPSVLHHLGPLGAHLLSSGWATTVVPDASHPKQLGGLILGFFVIFAMPNTQQILSRYCPFIGEPQPNRLLSLRWAPSATWAAALGGLLFLDLISLNYSPPFLYFQF